MSIEGKKKILMVDDEPALTRVVKLNLERTGRYEVRTENSGTNAVTAAREFDPDLVLLDIIMPDIEGSYVAAQFKEDAQLAGIPIVFFTAAASKEDVQKQGGIIGDYPFIAKPASLDQIIEAIERYAA